MNGNLPFVGTSGQTLALQVVVFIIYHFFFII